MHVATAGMSSCRYFSRKSVWFSRSDLTYNGILFHPCQRDNGNYLTMRIR